MRIQWSGVVKFTAQPLGIHLTPKHKWVMANFLHGIRLPYWGWDIMTMLRPWRSQIGLIHTPMNITVMTFGTLQIILKILISIMEGLVETQCAPRWREFLKWSVFFIYLFTHFLFFHWKLLENYKLQSAERQYCYCCYLHSLLIGDNLVHHAPFIYKVEALYYYTILFIFSAFG